MHWPVGCVIVTSLCLGCSADPGGSGTSFGGGGDDDPATTNVADDGDPATSSTGAGSTDGGSTGSGDTGTGADTTAADSTGDPTCDDPQLFFADADTDGFGDPAVGMEACEAPAGYVDNDDDCDDALSAVNPDADELCNGYDDDCDGIRDEYSVANAACESCTLDVRNDSVYWWCPGPVNRFAAREFCLDHGGDLTSIADLPEDGFVRGGVSGPSDWFIGLEDLAQEGVYEWSDGSPVVYTAWAPGEPNNVDNENCVELALEDNWNWNDTNCENTQGFICEAITPSVR